MAKTWGLLLAVVLVAGAGWLAWSYLNAPPFPEEPAGTFQSAHDLTGDWQGYLDVRGTALRLDFHFAETEGGGLVATLAVPQQGASDIPGTVSGEAPEIEVRFPSMRARLIGELNEAGDRIEGIWSQNGAELPLAIERAAMAEVPAPPVDLPYEQVPVEFLSADGVTMLVGEITRPDDSAPRAWVVLVSGSGPQDLDETVAGHKPFFAIADHLTRAGFGVLRFNDRGIGGSGGVFMDATIHGFVLDARGALDALPDDAAPRFMLGHSEGGLVIALAANAGAQVDGLILMSAPVISMGDVIVEQIRTLSAMAGASAAEIEAAVAMQTHVVDIILSEDDPVVAETRVRDYLVAQGQPEEAAAISAAQASHPSFRAWQQLDSQAVYAELDVPILALFGEKDTQVLAESSAAALELAQGERVGDVVRIVTLPGLNHLLQEAETGHPSEYGLIEETINPAALDEMSTWLDAQVGSAP